ncbi:MAG: glycosyltransferase, partial [Acidimicrobiales bacterium]|nr:glycosyltransferase [Acidimicrobiales bacterium]
MPVPAVGRLRLALVCPYSLSLPGGVQGQVFGLARAYRARGHEVSVVAPVDDVTPDLPAGVELVAVGHSVGVRANGSVAPVSLSLTAVRRGLRQIRAWEPDIVHVHEPFAPGVPLGTAMAR